MPPPPPDPQRSGPPSHDPLSSHPLIAVRITRASVALPIVEHILRERYNDVFGAHSLAELLGLLELDLGQTPIFVIDTNSEDERILHALQEYVRAGHALPPTVLLHKGGKAALGEFEDFVASLPILVLDHAVRLSDVTRFLDTYSPGSRRPPHNPPDAWHGFNGVDNQPWRPTRYHHPQCPSSRLARLRVPHR